MLTQETMIKYQTMLANGQTPTDPQEMADFEIVKAMMTSQAMAGNVATPAATAQPVQPATFQQVVPVAQPLQPAVVQAEVVYTPTPANGYSFTMDDMASMSTMAVDYWVKAKSGQIFLGNEKISDDPFYVIIDIPSVAPKLGIRAGNPPKYFYSSDGKTCSQGGTWFDAVSDARKIDPKAKPYACIDLFMKTAKEIRDYAGNIVAKAGTSLGYTTPPSNWTDWKRFYDGLPTHNESVFVKITRRDVKNTSNNEWSLLNYEYVSNEQAQQLGLIG